MLDDPPPGVRTQYARGLALAGLAYFAVAVFSGVAVILWGLV